MTEKRYKLSEPNGAYLIDDDKPYAHWINDDDKIIDLLNDLVDENEKLKQREERLLCEIEDFQELLAKNDDVCHKRVIDLIDDRISYFSDMKVELLLHSDDDYRLEKLSFAIQNLRELRKELME